MKESYDEGVANHIGPESCAGDRKGLSEALKGVRAGRVLSREMVLDSRVPILWTLVEGNGKGWRVRSQHSTSLVVLGHGRGTCR
jgi:hypothetical protein